MKNKELPNKEYEAFGPPSDNSDRTEVRRKIVLDEKDTPENVRELARQLFSKEGEEQKAQLSKKLSFSAFEEKLNEAKKRLFGLQ